MTSRKFLTGVAFVLSGLAANASAAEPDGTVDFTGDIVDTPCIVSSDSTALKVNLNKVKASSFTTVGTASPDVNFQINLEQCDITTKKNAQVTFTGQADSTNNKLLQITQGAGAATGVGIELTDAAGTAFDLNGLSPETLLQTGNSELHFRAHYKSTLAAVTPGAANAQAQFLVSYK
ncbi:fimbrial protein [Scandinavium goeteborgense]|uniref:fimbrial protein n=1 Tax=Scandinavium goeteborgense TaxID=1851514 RepID=UPI00216644DF|nr:fimbrial protein [Scandinavium goeteborgense]MCS2153786.1 fimbrial protein [Scandinavium goeteborgense]